MGKTGIFNVNRLLAEMMVQILGSNFKNTFPLIITENNYDLELFNGDTALMENQTAYFPGKRSFPAALLTAHEKAYALTVHKSQGSEYEHVLIILPDDLDNPLLTRELLYTAITRAKKSVAVYGSKEILSKTIEGRILRESGF